VAPGGTAVLADVVVPGRLARGERFEFERYLSRVRAVATTRDVADTDGGDHEATDSDDRLLFADATHLVPDAEGGDPSAPGVLGEDSVYGTAFVVAPDADVDLAALSDRLHAAVTAVGDDSTGAGTEPIPEPGRVRAGATELPNGAGVAIRALGDRAGSVESALVAGWDRARRELIDAPAPDGRKF
jgi:urease accessory protein